MFKYIVDKTITIIALDFKSDEQNDIKLLLK